MTFIRLAQSNFTHTGCFMLWTVLTLLLSPPVGAQELEIRRWNHLPIDQNFLTINYAHTSGEITVDPILQIDNLEVTLDTWLFSYVRTFELLDRTARIEIRQPWREGTWSGLVAGTPTSIDREGLDDTFVRLAVNVIGGPPLKGKAYADYRAATEIETIVGAALGVQLPTGEYMEDRLINLGSNRFTFLPQLGLQHKHYDWIFEVTGTAFIYTDNTSFFNGNRLEQAPLFSIDGSVEYDFPSGIWTSLGAGVRFGGQSTVNGVEKDDRKEIVGWSVSAGLPLTDWLGFKAAYIGNENLEEIGTSSRTVAVGLLATW
jgi:hypothetical protein